MNGHDSVGIDRTVNGAAWPVTVRMTTYHVWFATKNRKCLLEGDLEDRVVELFSEMARKHGIKLLAVGTKEAVGGYYIVDCDEAEAIAIAARIPIEARSWVQVRPIALFHPNAEQITAWGAKA